MFEIKGAFVVYVVWPAKRHSSEDELVSESEAELMSINFLAQFMRSHCFVSAILVLDCESDRFRTWG